MQLRSPLIDSRKFRGYDPSEARLLSYAVGEPQWISESTSRCLRLSRVNPAKWLTAAITVDLSIGQLEVPIALPPHVRWAELLLPAVRELPPQLLAAIMSHVLEPILSAIAEWTDSSPQVLRWPSQLGDVARSMIAMNVGSTADDSSFDVLLPVVSPAIVELFMSRSAAPHCESRVDIYDVVVQAALEVASVELSSRDVRSLGVGDIVALDVTPVQALPRTMHAMLRMSNSKIAVGSVKSNSFLVHEIELQPMNHTPPSNLQTAEDPTRAVDDLMLSCSVVIPAGDIRVGDIGQWAAGTLVTLPVSIDSDRIALHVGQQMVARGRLVAIGDQLGLELVETFRS